MNLSKLEKRNTSADIIRIVAVFLVISVHFLFHTYANNPAIGGTDGFYHRTVNGYGPIDGVIKYWQQGDPKLLEGPLFYLMILMKVLFSACVPLFIILTGYLMSGKTLSKGYYKGIRKTLIVFVLATFACMFFKSIHDTKAAKDAFYAADYQTMFDAIGKTGKFTFKNYLFSIFDFSGANYSWYVEMYIGLFLIAPFLNLSYNKLETKRKKQVLVATCVFLMILPSLFNIFKLDSGAWWMNPASDGHYQKLIPAFWVSAYPIAFYFTGAYIREYGFKLRTRSMLALFFAALFLFTAFDFYRSKGGKFQSGNWLYWNGFQPYVISVLLFVMLSRIKANNWHPTVRTVLWKISDLTYGMYLLSFIFDKLIYTELNKNFPDIFDKLPYYFVTVPLCFVLSMIASIIANLAAKGIIILYEKTKVFAIAQRERDDKQKWQDFLFIALMLGAVVFALWKAPYGFGGNDEPFYLTIPHRLTKGDALFRDEWNLAQMCSILQLPFVWVYTTIMGSTDGIILAARIFYVFVHCGASALIYIKLRKYGYLSVFAGVLYFIFTPYNIMALSYDSMGVELTLLAGVLIATADYSKKLQLIFSGLCFAGAVLCTPYLASVYVLYLLCVGVHLAIRKRNFSFVLKSEMFSLKSFLFFTLGVGILAVIFLLFTLPRVGFEGLSENLQYMLQDPEHPSVPFDQKFGKYFESIFKMNASFKYAIYSYCAMAAVMLIDRKRRLHRSVYLIVTVGIVIYSYILLVPDFPGKTYNSIMLPPVFAGITSYALCKNKPRELFAGVFLTGIFYSLCVFLPSNQYMYVISMGFAAVNVASFIFVGQLIREMQETPDNVTYAVWVKRLSFAMVAFMLLFQGNLECYSKSHHCFWNGDPKDLTFEIAEGPAAGLRTDKTKADEYNSIYNDLSRYWDKEDDNLLILTERTWTYLAADKPYGTFSAWLSGEKPNSIKRLKSFYDINPDKKPRYIYVPKKSKWNMTWLLNELQLMGYSYTETSAGYALEKYR